MLRQRRQLFEFFFMGCDLAVVSLAWVVAYYLRFYTGLVEVDKGIPPFGGYALLLLFIWLIWAFVFRRIGLYQPMRATRRSREIWLLIEANVISTVLFIALTYLFREKEVQFSRLVFVYFGGIATGFTIAMRAALRFFLRDVRRRGYNLRFVLVVGAGKVAADIVARVRSHRELGYQIVGCLSRDGSAKRGERGIPVIGAYGDLAHLLATLDIDQVIVALPLEDHHEMPKVIEQIGDSLIDLKIVPDVYQFVRVGGRIEEFEGLPVISVQESPLDSLNLFSKRALDIVVASVAILVLSPLMLLIAVLIRVTSRGPIFYAQERLSYDGTRFNILKFRSMRTDAEEAGPGWTTRGDQRVTWLGRFLRATSLDELPQLFNVLRGDMSLVGPRPERPVFIEEFRRRVPRYMLRHKVPAGMTGWAQIHGWRGDTSIDKRIEFDMYYIENWSLLLDLKIMCLTVLRGFFHRNAC